MMSIRNDITASRQYLDWDKISARIMIPREVLEDCISMTEVFNEEVDRLVITMVKAIHNDPLEPKEVKLVGDAYFYYPTTWWDHFKRDHRNKWYLKPLVWYKHKRGQDVVNITSHKRTVLATAQVSVKMLFPDIQKKYPTSLGRKFVYYELKEVSWYNDTKGPNDSTTRQSDIPIDESPR